MIIHRKDQLALNDYIHVLNNAPENVKVVLEFGTDKGGSLKLWDDLFKPDLIIGLDHVIADADLIAVCEGLEAEIILESFNQRDPVSIVTAMQTVKDHIDIRSSRTPYIDIMIDDCCHDASAIDNTLDAFWDLLKEGGLYIIEDWQADGASPLRGFIVDKYLELDAVEMIVRKSMIVFVK